MTGIDHRGRFVRQSRGRQQVNTSLHSTSLLFTFGEWNLYDLLVIAIGNFMGGPQDEFDPETDLTY
jgi:hypothetical protein